MPVSNAAFYPIIYVRGYAMTQTEIDETTVDPFCGFNLGSTVFRATPDKNKPPKKFVFESPVVRLQSDFGYQDVFENGLDILDPEWEGKIPSKSIIVYRYYESASTVLGVGKTPSMEEFARGLSDLILRVRQLVSANPDNKVDAKDFRCYLVAHSMGGLVCRAFLQNRGLGEPAARECVDKVFTYATPHNGIEFAGINVPSWLTRADINNFNRERMAEYLDPEGKFPPGGRVDWLPETVFPSRRFFCMIGTNRDDYEVAKGMSRTFSGHGSDGLVRIDNASVWGFDADGKFSAPCATAFAYRSHSGYFGIVNSEESYQNLIRFLFGEVRVDIYLDVEEVRLPPDVQAQSDARKEINALYQFETWASPRGKRWFLTRRVAEEDSVACRPYKELKNATKDQPTRIYLSSVFLDRRWRIDPNDPTLAYSLTLGARVPDYEVDRKFWFNAHYEGGYLFRDSIILNITLPQKEQGEWKVLYDWQSKKLGQATTPVRPESNAPEGEVWLTIPFGKRSAPGIVGNLVFKASRWNN